MKSTLSKIKNLITKPMTPVFITYEEILAESKQYIGKVRKKKEYKITTNINRRIAAEAVACRSIDLVLEEKLQSELYTQENPLVILNPYGKTPLTALLLFSTKTEVEVNATVKGIKEEYDYKNKGITATHHRVCIFGLYADRKNEVVIELVNKNGKVIQKDTIFIQTQPLPEKLLNMVTVKKHTVPSALPFILIGGKAVENPFVFDEMGAIRYYLSDNPRYGFFPLQNKKVAFIDKETYIPTNELPHSTRFYEMDYLGRVYTEYLVPNGVHHDFGDALHAPNKKGNFFFASNCLDGYVEDAICEVDRKTGEVVKVLDLKELFGEYFCHAIDWAHTNTVSYDASTNTIFICPRNLHSGIKIDWATNEVLWILGDPSVWKDTKYKDKVLKPVGDFIWHYQPHSVWELQEDLDGNPDTAHVIVFDNHRHKKNMVETFVYSKFSFVKLYTIHLKEKTVTMEHSYKGAKSKITSNGWLEFDKKRMFSMSAFFDPLVENCGGMVYEYDYDTEEVLNQYLIQYYYYRGYPFCLSFEELSQRMPQNKDYMKGSLHYPKLIDNWNDLEKKEEELPTKSGIMYKMTEHLFFVKAKDHDIRKVFLVGTNQQYVRDYSDTTQHKEEFFGSNVYYIAVPMDQCKPDQYEIWLDYKDSIYNTGKFIAISEKN